MVLQVERTEILAADAYGNCRMRGTVIRSFRGPVEAGTRIESTVACAWDGMIGARVYWEREDLAAAPVLELHIRPGRGGVGWVVMLDAPTEAIAWRGEDCEGRPLGG